MKKSELIKIIREEVEQATKSARWRFSKSELETPEKLNSKDKLYYLIGTDKAVIVLRNGIVPGVYADGTKADENDIHNAEKTSKLVHPNGEYTEKQTDVLVDNNGNFVEFFEDPSLSPIKVHGDDFWGIRHQVPTTYSKLKGEIRKAVKEVLAEKEGPCWKGYKMVGMKKKNGKEVPNCVPDPENKIANMKKVKEILDKVNEGYLEEAEYQGREVTLNKPFRTPKGPKKFSVYVKNDKGNVVKVNFGDPDMEIRRDDPEARKSFRARHKCDQKKDKTKAGYWSCYQWRAGKKVED